MRKWLMLIGVVSFILPGSASAQPAAIERQLLLGDLNCTACHTADPAAAQRIMPRLSPSLANAGQRLTPQYLRAILAKPVGAMPDMLHALPADEKSKAIDDLVQYLMSLGKAPKEEPASPAASTILIQQGAHLYHSIGCVACHAPLQPPPKSADEDKAPTEIPTLTGVPLGDLAAKTTLPALAAFLLDPLQTHPSGRMPSLKLTQPEAHALAAYLLRDQAAKDSPASVAGLAYSLYQAKWNDLQSLEKLKPKLEGVVDKLSVETISAGEESAVRFSGQLEIAKEGKYTINFAIRDQVQFLLNGNKIALKGGRRDKTMEAIIELTAGQHPFDVIIKQQKGPGTLEATWITPGEKNPVAIPSKVFSHAGMKMIPRGQADFTPDPAKAARGKTLFATLACAACHATDGPAKPASAPDLAKLDPAKAGGCLDAKVIAGRPAYTLSDAQRTSLRQAIDELKSVVPPDDATIVQATLKAFNCAACHARQGVGGPEAARSPYFTSVIEIDLGDEGRLPPHLNEAGAKISQSGLEKILFEGSAVRPYLATRMPQFGKSSLAHLPAALAKADAARVPARNDAEPPFSPKLIDDGRRLVGTQGLGCVNCHGWGTYKSLGPPAVNLLAAPGRLNRSYVHAYLAEPARWRPGTRMPAFWTEGQNALKEVQGGDMQRQIDAIWAYLQMGERGGVPVGMAETNQDLLIPTNEPIVFRTFVRSIGAHVIAVGFRQKTHVAFDALRVRMADAWSGDFIRTGPTWVGRAGSYTDLPSKEVVHFPAGSPLATLESQTAPWPAIDLKVKAAPPGWRFRGYRYEDDRTPTFLYSFNQIDVEETPSAQYSPTGGEITRTLHFTAPKAQQNVYFRAAAGDKITAETDGSWTIDGKVKISIKTSAAAAPMQRTTPEGKQELLVPLDFSAAGADKVQGNIEVKVSW